MRGPQRDEIASLLFNGLPGWILGLAGLALLAISLFADTLGLGGPQGIIGWKQLAGSGGGALLVFVGAWYAIRVGRRTESAGASVDHSGLC